MNGWGAWLAQSVEHVTSDLGVMSMSPKLGVEFALKKDEWINKLWCVYSMEYYSATKRKKSAASCYNMDHEDIIVSERRQFQKATYSMILFICNVQNGKIHNRKKLD